MGRRSAGKGGRSWRAAREKAPPPPAEAPAIAERLPRAAPTGLIGLVTAIMLSWTWDRWPNLLVRFWARFVHRGPTGPGQGLYRDVAFFTGPLSPYLNALWFHLFGPTLQTLVFCNVILFIGFLWLLYQVLRRVGSRTAATAATVVFVTMFGHGRPGAHGQLHFICPYSHDMVHGLALSLGRDSLPGPLHRCFVCTASCSGRRATGTGVSDPRRDFVPCLGGLRPGIGSNPGL